MAQRFVEHADDDVVGADVRHVGGKADQDHDQHAQSAATAFKQAVYVVVDVGEDVAGRFFDEFVAGEKGDGQQGKPQAEQDAFGVVAFDD